MILQISILTHQTEQFYTTKKLKYIYNMQTTVHSKGLVQPLLQSDDIPPIITTMLASTIDRINISKVQPRYIYICGFTNREKCVMKTCMVFHL